MTESSRMDLHRGKRRTSRVLGVVLGVLVIAVLLGGGFAAWRWRTEASRAPIERLVVVGESELEDKTTVAGLVVVMERDDRGRMRLVPADTAEPVAIPGTSYDRLRDALPMGGPDQLVPLVADGEAGTAWLVLPESRWAELLSGEHAAAVSVPGTTTVFTGSKLYRFRSGADAVEGMRAAALVRGSELFGDKTHGAGVRLALGNALGRAVAAQPDVVGNLVASGDAETSADVARLRAFLDAP